MLCKYNAMNQLFEHTPGTFKQMNCFCGHYFLNINAHLHLFCGYHIHTIRAPGIILFSFHFQGEGAYIQDGALFFYPINFSYQYTCTFSNHSYWVQLACKHYKNDQACAMLRIMLWISL